MRRLGFSFNLRLVFILSSLSSRSRVRIKKKKNHHKTPHLSDEVVRRLRKSTERMDSKIGFVNQTMTSSKSKETSGGWSLINHVLRTPTASSPLWSGSRIFFLLLSSNLRLGTLVIWYPRTKCYQSAWVEDEWKEKKEKEKIRDRMDSIRDSSQPLTGHWRPNFSRTNLMIQTFGRLEKLSTVGSRHVIFILFRLPFPFLSLSSSTHIHIRFTHDNRRLGLWRWTLII